MEKKYELTKEKVKKGKHVLYRIKALKDFGNVKAGDLGGFIENESNLSHDGNCWVYDEAFVFGNAKIEQNASITELSLVFGNACVSGNAFICGNTKVFGKATIGQDAHIGDSAKVYGCASIGGKAIIGEYACVYGSAIVIGKSLVRGRAKVYDNAVLDGDCSILYKAVIKNNSKIIESAIICGNASISNACIRGNTIISNNGWISSENDCFSVDYIGSRKDATTFYKGKYNNIYVVCGCFLGTIDEFEKKVKETHGDNKYAKEYNLAIEMAKLHILG